MGPISGLLLDWGFDEWGDLFLMTNLTSKWRRPEMKNMRASMTMMKRTAGLILLPDDGGGDCNGEGKSQS